MIIIISLGVGLIIAFLYLFYFSGLYRRTNDYNKASAAMAKGEYEKAIEMARLDISKHPLSLYSLKLIGYSYYKLDKYNEAIEYLSKALKYFPNDVALLSQRQSAYFNQGNYDLAMKDIERLLKLNYKDLESYLNWSYYLFERNLYDSSLIVCDKAKTICNVDARLWQNYGSSFYGLEEYGKALECYDSALKYLPGKKNALHGKALSLYQLGRYDEAIALTNKLIEARFKTCHIHWLRGDAYSSQGKWINAAMDYAVALDSLSNEYRLWLSKAEAEYNFQDYNSSLLDAKKGIELAQVNSGGIEEYSIAESLYHISWIYYLKGEKDSAYLYFQYSQEKGYSDIMSMADSFAQQVD